MWIEILIGEFEHVALESYEFQTDKKTQLFALLAFLANQVSDGCFEYENHKIPSQRNFYREKHSVNNLIKESKVVV